MLAAEAVHDYATPKLLGGSLWCLIFDDLLNRVCVDGEGETLWAGKLHRQLGSNSLSTFEAYPTQKSCASSLSRNLHLAAIQLIFKAF